MRPDEQSRARWRVRRTAGLLVPGFSKRFDRAADEGVTFLLGLPIGRFRIVVSGTVCELHYLRWPVVDVLDALPHATPLAGAGFLRLPGGRRVRFCRFRLEPPATH